MKVQKGKMRAAEAQYLTHSFVCLFNVYAALQGDSGLVTLLQFLTRKKTVPHESTGSFQKVAAIHNNFKKFSLCRNHEIHTISW